MNIPGDLEILHDIDHCRQSIIENANTKAIFLITSCSASKKVLEDFPETYGFIKRIYALGDYMSEIVDHPPNRDVDTLVFDLHNNLLIHLLQDISKYYLSTGEDYKNSISSSTESALIYFDLAKEMLIHAN